MPSIDSYYKIFDKNNKAELDRQKELTTNASNMAINNAVGVVEEEKAKLPQYYQPYFDANAVQHLVNQRQLEERMANLGLTDSGLNRTQMTALTVQKQNTDAAYNQRKQAAIKSLDDQIAQIKASGQLQLQSNLLALDQNYQTQRNTWASNAYKADMEYAAETQKNNNSLYNEYIKKQIQDGNVVVNSDGTFKFVNDPETNNGGNNTPDALGIRWNPNYASLSAGSSFSRQVFLDVWANYVANGGNEEKFAQYLDEHYPNYDAVALLQYAQAMSTPEKWIKKNDGFWNFMGGVDEDGSVTDPYGQEYTGFDMLRALEQAGMKKTDAENWITDMQRKKGILAW